jgi:hypothetical protein
VPATVAVTDLMMATLAEFTPLYEAAASRGVAADALDRCLIWQVAAMLGVKPATAEAPGGPRLSGEALIRARVRAARGQAPPVVPARHGPPKLSPSGQAVR